jgi:hypothetical protein
VPSVHGISLAVDQVTHQTLHPWLDRIDAPPGSPTVEVRLTRQRTMPKVLDFVIREPNAWLGRTASGLLIGGVGEAWFSIEGAPPIICCGGLRAKLDPSDGERIRLLDALVAALRTIGVHTLHAGVVCTDEAALILLGDSGSGKSTTATALVSDGCHYLGDDEVLLRESAGALELLSFWPAFRLTERVLGAFMWLRSHLSKADTDPKWELRTAEAFPGQQLHSWQGPTVLLFLARSAAECSRLAPITLSEATGLLIAQSTALGLDCHPNPREHLQLLARLAHLARCARLELGREWLSDPIGAARRLKEAVRSLSLPPRQSEAS